MNVHVRRGDTVAVLAGKERGKRGKVLRVLPETGRVLVEHVNMIKRHQRPTQRLRQGGIIEREGYIHLSNVMVVCGKCDRPARSASRRLDDGRKVRLCKRCGESIDKA
jgi:large subunit ribosomal protein L24